MSAGPGSSHVFLGTYMDEAAQNFLSHCTVKWQIVFHKSNTTQHEKNCGQSGSGGRRHFFTYTARVTKGLPLGCDEEIAVWSRPSPSRETPRDASQQTPAAGRGRENSPFRVQKKPGPADILVLDFQPPE